MELVSGYRELPPPASARGALACVWFRVVEARDPATAPRVLPDGCVDLIWMADRGAFIAGPDTGPTVMDLDADGVFVGARFLPGAGGSALGLPLAELRDLRVDLAELFPELDQRLPADLSPREALERVTAIAAGLAAAGPPDPAIRAAARRLRDPRTRVESLADDLGLSERQLRRRCHAGVGYGPKTLQRVLRFRRFVACAGAGGDDADLARLALDAGYADQAHLTRECTRLAGLTPGALVRARARSGG